MIFPVARSYQDPYDLQLKISVAPRRNFFSNILDFSNLKPGYYKPFEHKDCQHVNCEHMCYQHCAELEKVIFHSFYNNREYFLLHDYQDPLRFCIFPHFPSCTFIWHPTTIRHPRVLILASGSDCASFGGRCANMLMYFVKVRWYIPKNCENCFAKKNINNSEFSNLKLTVYYKLFILYV